MKVDPSFEFWRSAGDGTRAVHAGDQTDAATGAVVAPICLATSFAQEAVGVPRAGFEYGRSGNPTRDAWERCCAALEGAEYGVACASGLGALATLTQRLRCGDHVVAMKDGYGGSYRYFTRVAARGGLEFSFVDFTDVAAVRAALRPETRMLFFESPSNPTLRLVDIAAVAEVGRAAGVLVAVDNTFATPVLQRPIANGADVVLHSATKYLNGHSDVIHGVLVTRSEQLADELHFMQRSMGAVPSPMDCWLCLRGVKTLVLRVAAHCANAQAVAEFLEAHPAVDRVLYPGLASHPQHELARRLMPKGFGGMVSFYIKGGAANAQRFLSGLTIFTLAESLGAVESLAGYPVAMSHASFPVEERLAMGITDQMIRLSVGIEDVSDLIADLRRALGE
jgi:cystathionine gamma-lyase